MIRTERLLLRQFRHEDWPAMHEHYSDLEATRYTFRRALTEGESWRAMASAVGHWAIRGYGPYAIELLETNAVVGIAGLWYPNDWPEPEIKWALLRRHWGRGYAAEAVRAIQREAPNYLGETPPISFINGENAASIKLALAVGATLERTTEFRGSEWHVYRHPRLA
jgi:RimJ/RimL family protein N-acetyltransferase